MASQDIAQNLRDNNNNWRAVKQAIEDKGVSTTGLTTADYDDAIRSIPTSANLETLNVTPTTSQQTIVPSQIDGWDEVVVAAVDYTIDANIIAENIKSGVTILGVTGNYSGGGSNYQQKTIEPNFSNGNVVVNADNGYDALSQVTIQKDVDLIPQNIKNGITVHGVVGSYTGGGTGGVQLNDHPTSLAYAGSGDSGNSSHCDVLPIDGSWTTAVDIANLNVSNGFRSVFYNNTTVTNLDLRGWDFSSREITNIGQAFYNCSSLVTILGTLKLNKCNAYSNTFQGCTSLVDCPITNFGFDTATSTLTLDLSASAVLDAHTMIQNMETNNSGKTRILKLHPTVLAGLSSADTALAASKNITLQ